MGCNYSLWLILASVIASLLALTDPVFAEDVAADAPVIRAVDSPTARFDSLAQELLNQTEPTPTQWRPVRQTPSNFVVENQDIAPGKSVASSPQQANLPVLQWPPHMPGAVSTPLMRRSMHGANGHAIPAARQIITAKLDNTAKPDSSTTTDGVPVNALATVANEKTDTASAAKATASTPVKPEAAAQPLFTLPPLVKVPSWLWGTLAAVFVGLAMLTVASTIWLVQRMWHQNRPNTKQPAPLTLTEPPPATDPPLLEAPPALKAYASAPKSRRGVEVRKLLQPTPTTVSAVLSHWVANVSQVRQA